MRQWLFQNIANFITGIRFIDEIYLAILFIYSPFDWQKITVAMVICFATDVSDGIVARRLHIESKFGAGFDALADKILAIEIFIATAVRYWPPANVSGILITCAKYIGISLFILETILALICLITYFKGYRDFHSVCWGKRKADAEGLIVFIWIISLAEENYWHEHILQISVLLIDLLLLVAIGCFIISAVIYWKRYNNFKKLRV